MENSPDWWQDVWVAEIESSTGGEMSGGSASEWRVRLVGNVRWLKSKVRLVAGYPGMSSACCAVSIEELFSNRAC